MTFEDKLRQLSDRADAASLAALNRQTRTLASLVAHVLRDGAWSTVAAKTDKALSDAALEARGWARIRDATGYLEDKVFEPKTGRIEELRLRGDLRFTQDEILQRFETGEWPKRGFVYVAWSQRPEQYYYVGKARGVDRLNLAAHGKLANATAYATQLALLFPSQSRDEILGGVEAALLALVEFHTGELPRLNERREKTVPHRGHNSLRELSGFLRTVATDLHDGS